MQHTIYPKGIRVLATAGLAFALTWTAALAAIADSARNVRLDAGTVIPITLDNNLSSNNSRPGDTFTATVQTDNGQDYDGVPSGSKIEGVVRTAKPQEGNNPGVLDLDFRRLRLPDERSVAINGSLIGLDNKSVTRASDGRLIAKPSHKNDRLTYVGYGAGAGLIVGLLTRHTLEDTVIGGGLGYLFGALQKNHSDARDVVLKPGSQMGVRLDSRVAFTDYPEDSGYRYQDNSRLHRSGTGAGGYRYGEGGEGSNYDRGATSGDEMLDIGVLIDDRDVRFESAAPPAMSKGAVLIPAIPVLRSAHVPYNWDAARGLIRTSGAAGSMRLSVDSRVAVINGSRRVRLEMPAQKLNGTIYVPAQFLALAMGDDYHFDPSSRTVVFTSRENP